MTPSAIPRRYLWVAAGAAGTFGLLYLRNRFGSKVEDHYERDASGKEGRSPSGPASKSPLEEREAARTQAAATAGGPDAAGGRRELAEFLAGDSWYDESGWRSIWDREGVDDAAAWLRGEGTEVLGKARASLSDHPALLAGCRRRWIVVCRYAGIDVSDAAGLWNHTDAAAA
jgi:hypothetical protein